jgi:hypothetical protein
VLLEAAKPVTLIFCIISLCAVFNAAFLDQAIDIDQRIYSSLARLAIAAAVCLLSGFVFLADDDAGRARKLQLKETLPARMFFWASSVMTVVFLMAWYLEAHCILFRSVRVW